MRLQKLQVVDGDPFNKVTVPPSQKEAINREREIQRYAERERERDKAERDTDTEIETAQSMLACVVTVSRPSSPFLVDLENFR
jgi:hypothetical protein